MRLNDFFMNKLIKDVHSFIKGTDVFGYNVSCIDDSTYPLDLSFTLIESNFYYKNIDENGIPYRVYSSVGKQYNPTRVAAYGLAHYNDYINNGSQESKKVFLSMADWFMSKPSGEYGYSFDWEDLKAPWLSCMAQGEAASLLVRAYKTTDNKAYLDQALLSLKPLYKTIVEGGVQSLIDNKYIFLEEYPSFRSAHVLNGFLYALTGVIETRLITEDKDLKYLEENLVYSLIENLHRWGTKYWSYYQIDSDKVIKNFCTPAYHNLHITQLKFINKHYPDPKLEEKIYFWSKGSYRMDIRMRALIGKATYRIINKAQR